MCSEKQADVYMWNKKNMFFKRTENMKESSKILKDGVYGLELKYYPSFQIQGG